MVDCTTAEHIWGTAESLVEEMFFLVEQTLGPMPSQEWQDWALQRGFGINIQTPWTEFPGILTSRSDACWTALHYLSLLLNNFDTDMTGLVTLLAAERRMETDQIQSFNVGHGGSTFHHVYLPQFVEYLRGNQRTTCCGFSLPLVWLQGDSPVIQGNTAPFVNNWEYGVLGQDIWADAAHFNQWSPEDPGRWLIWAAAIYMYMMYEVKRPLPGLPDCMHPGNLGWEPSEPWMEAQSCGSLNAWQTRSGYYLGWTQFYEASRVRLYCNANEPNGPHFCGAEHCGTHCPEEFACQNSLAL